MTNGAAASLSRYQLRVLAILALINFVNFADRTVILPLFPVLRDEFSLSGTELGSLQTVLQIVLSVATVPLALLADRMSRTHIIAAGVVFWSLATFLTGAAHAFWLLLLARALVGVGEGAYGPAAQSIISGTFSAAARARAQAVFAAGMLIGGAAGQAMGGVLGEALGWRYAFFIVGVPGLLLGLMVLRLEEPPRGPRSELLPVRVLLGVPAYVALVAGGVLVTFAAISFITWGPDYVVRFKGFSLREAGVSLGAVGFASLVLGVLVGGYLADLLQKRFVYGRVVTISSGFLLATPFILWALEAESKESVLTVFFLGSFFMSWYHGPVAAVIHDMMPRRAHATSVGVYQFVTQLVGGTLAPVMVGALDDRHTLHAGLLLAVAMMVVGALTLFLVARFIRRDGMRHPSLDAYRAQHDET
jgi:predicted MFS family arabinose efflux permease